MFSAGNRTLPQLMQGISQASEYAIRALTYIAQRQGEGYQLARTIAEDIQLPAPFLSKILVTLVGRGVLKSQRGRGGGFCLSREPEEVTLYAIVDSQEDLSRPRPCLLGQDECSDERACPMHEFWSVASAQWLARLETTTLRDLVQFCEERSAGSYPASS